MRVRHDVEVGPPLTEMPSFVGGLRLRLVFANWGWPGARLTLCNEGVRIGPAWTVFRPFVPVRPFRYDDLSEVQAIGNSLGMQGIRFCSHSSGRWAIFWTFSRARRTKILEILRTLTSNVNSDPIWLNFWNPGPSTK
jgi:hypothetical protein